MCVVEAACHVRAPPELWRALDSAKAEKQSAMV
jgi:hypothetical protein